MNEMGRNIPGGNLLGGNFPGGDFPGGSLMGGSFPGIIKKKPIKSVLLRTLYLLRIVKSFHYIIAIT